MTALRVRDLGFGVLAQAASWKKWIDGLAKAGKTRGLVRALPVSDQAQMREFYLSKMEEVDLRNCGLSFRSCISTTEQSSELRRLSGS